jgi:hypothetical protein
MELVIDSVDMGSVIGVVERKRNDGVLATNNLVPRVVKLISNNRVGPNRSSKAIREFMF